MEREGGREGERKEREERERERDSLSPDTDMILNCSIRLNSTGTLRPAYDSDAIRRFSRGTGLACEHGGTKVVARSFISTIVGLSADTPLGRGGRVPGSKSMPLRREESLLTCRRRMTWLRRKLDCWGTGSRGSSQSGREGK